MCQDAKISAVEEHILVRVVLGWENKCCQDGNINAVSG